MMEEKMETRAAREIVAMMGDKALFSYIPGMEIKTMESDSRSSLDKIACYFHEEQFAISDLYIGSIVLQYRKLLRQPSRCSAICGHKNISQKVLTGMR